MKQFMSYPRFMSYGDTATDASKAVAWTALAAPLAIGAGLGYAAYKVKTPWLRLLLGGLAAWQVVGGVVLLGAGAAVSQQNAFMPSTTPDPNSAAAALLQANS